MSVDASIDFTFGPHSDALALLEALVTMGWESGAHRWMCVPLGADASEWEATSGTQAVFDLLRSKLLRGEVFGIQLLWDATDTGGEFLIFSNQQASFVATINRVQLDQRTTDVSWYLERPGPVDDAVARLENVFTRARPFDPRSLLEPFIQSLGLRQLGLPVKLGGYKLSQAWAVRTRDGHAQRWFRAAIAASVRCSGVATRMTLHR